MGVMPEGIAKGIVLQKLDDRYRVLPTNDPVYVQYIQGQFQKRLAALKALPPYPAGNLATYAERAGVLTPQQAWHMRAHWFNDPDGNGSNDPDGPGWWKAIQPIEPILREGLITAIEVALCDFNTFPPPPRLRPLPIVFYWVCHPGHESRKHNKKAREAFVEEGIEVDIGWSDQEVTFIFHTPDPEPDNTPNPDDEPLFVVKRDHVSKDVVRVRVKTRRYPY